MLHGGQSPSDVYRRIYGGINGTPMPAFKDAMAADPDTMWHLAHYVLHLADQRRRNTSLGPVNTAAEAAESESAPQPDAPAATPLDPAGDAAPPSQEESP